MSPPSLLTFLADVMMTKKAAFIERWDMKQVAIGSKGGLVRNEWTRLTSHCGLGFLLLDE